LSYASNVYDDLLFLDIDTTPAEQVDGRVP